MAGVDLGVFGRQKTIVDQQQLQDAFELKKALAAQQIQKAARGGDLPAPLQLANEYQARIAAGDVAGANTLAAFAKTQDKGLVMGPDGNYYVAGGYAPAVGEIAQAKGYGTQMGKDSVTMQTAGPIAAQKANATNASDLSYKPMIGKETEFQKALGKGAAETQSGLKERVAQMPELEKTVAELSSLGQSATYTTAGRVIDAFRKEADMKPRDAAIARAEYVAKVDNQVLPLLRQTFGAAFTQKEGDTLRNTLGDANKSPAEKDAVLRAFIEQKRNDIKTMSAQTQSLDDVLSGYQSAQPQAAAPGGWSIREVK